MPRSWTTSTTRRKKNTRECDPGIRSVDTEGNWVFAEQYDAVVTEGLSILAKKSDKTAAVLYGVRGFDDCRTVETLRRVRRVDRVVRVRLR